jgi:hypothetical protein
MIDLRRITTNWLKNQSCLYTRHVVIKFLLYAYTDWPRTFGREVRKSNCYLLARDSEPLVKIEKGIFVYKKSRD